MADPFFLSGPGPVRAKRKRANKAASDEDEEDDVGANVGMSDDEEEQSSADEGGKQEGNEEDGPFANETPDETRLRLAERYVRKLEALAAQASEEEEEEEEDRSSRVVKRLKQDVLEASGRYRRRLAGQISFPDRKVPDSAIRTIRGHQLPLTCVSLSNDDKIAYTGSKDGTIIQYDLEIGKRLWRGGRAPEKEAPKGGKGKGNKRKRSKDSKDKTKGHVGHVLAVAISPDGRLLASGGDDRLVHLWDTRTHAHINTFPGHRKTVTGLAFRQGSDDLYSASADGTVKVWNTAQMSYVETLFGHQAPIMSIDCLSQERPLTAGGMDRSIRIFKVAEETHLLWKGHTAPIDGAAYLTDQLYASISQDGSVNLWDLGLKKPRSTVPNAHGGHWVTAVAACRQSDLMCTGSSDGVIRFWNAPPAGVGKLEEILTASAPGFVNGLAIAQSARFAVAALGTEPRMGRWERIPEARNVLSIIPLTMQTSS